MFTQLVRRIRSIRVRQLVRKLASGNVNSRIAAARWLADLHAHEAVPALLDCLEYAHRKYLHNLREEVTKALGAIGDERAIPALFNHLLFDPTFDLWGSLNPSAFDALVKIGGPKVLDGFVRTLEQEHQESGIQILAAKSLAKMGKSLVALDALQKRLDENEQNGKISSDLRRAISRDLRRAINDIRRERRTTNGEPNTGLHGDADKASRP